MGVLGAGADAQHAEAATGREVAARHQYRPDGVKVARTSCVDSATPMPSDMHQTNQQHGQCKVAKLDSRGGTVRWESTCTQASDGTAVHSEGIAHYSGDTMTADVKTVVNSPGGAPNDTAQRVTGHYLGPCDVK
jgi:Protein of unknown function (DUF3617)